MATRTYAEQIHGWEILSGNIKPLLKEQPHLAPLLEELESLVAEARRLESQRLKYTAKLRGVNERRAQVGARGQEVKTRLEDHLRAHFGPKSIAVLQFGFRPRTGGPKSRRRPRPPEPEPEAPN